MASTLTIGGAQRILAGVPGAVCRVALSDQDGNLANAAGTLTADIARADGTILATGRATTTAGTGRYEVALTAAEVASLDVLTVTWLDGGTARATTWHRLVGGFLFSVAELRAMNGLGDASRFPDAALSDARDRITDLIEDYTGAAWCPRFDRVEEQVLGAPVMALPCVPVRSVRSVAFDGVAQTVADLRVDPLAGVLSWAWFAGLVAVGVEHGYAAPPAQLKRAALIGAQQELLQAYSGVSYRALGVTNDIGNISYARAGRENVTGIPEVDAVLNSPGIMHRVPGLA